MSNHHNNHKNDNIMAVIASSSSSKVGIIPSSLIMFLHNNFKRQRIFVIVVVVVLTSTYWINDGGPIFWWWMMSTDNNSSSSDHLSLLLGISIPSTIVDTAPSETATTLEQEEEEEQQQQTSSFSSSADHSVANENNNNNKKNGVESISTSTSSSSSSSTSNGSSQQQQQQQQKLSTSTEVSSAKVVAVSSTTDVAIERKQTKKKKKNVRRTKKPIVSTTDFIGLSILSKSDSIYTPYGTWDEAPIVIESHKLLFFTIPKVGCTIFKQLFRRMYGYTNWYEHNDHIPHEPSSNGLNYLYHYTPQEANDMLTSNDWTRAIFFREPKERLLSAYLDKGLHLHGKYIQVHCCNIPGLSTILQCSKSKDKNKNNEQPLISFEEFLKVIYPKCIDPHWRSQSNRMPRKYWQYINFVGHLDNVQHDTRRLLERIDAWTTYGSTGWKRQRRPKPNDSNNNNNNKNIIIFDVDDTIFAGSTGIEHATSANEQLRQYYTSELEDIAEHLHGDDYDNPLFNLTKRRFITTTTR